MSKIEKKKMKIRERIAELESELILHLTKKSSNVREIDVPLYQRRINDLKLQLKT